MLFLHSFPPLMGKAEPGSIKAIANKMKSRGLGKLRFYCQTCSKQCRDENGFKSHVQSESHLRLMLSMGSSGGASRVIQDYSMRVQSEFLQLLSRSFGTKRVLMNRAYQLYIADKNHVHLNATRFKSLTSFCKHLGRTGMARVDVDEQGWWIAWIDTSQGAIERQEALLKKDRMTLDDETRERRLIEEQIEKARELEKQQVETEKGNKIGGKSDSDDEGEAGTETGLERQTNLDETTDEVSKKISSTGPVGPISLTFQAPTKQTTTFVNPARQNPFKRK